MIKVLINAYACSPHTGSEPGMAWNWCVHLAKHCELYIITEGEFQHHIEEALVNLPQGKNMHFFYNPVSHEIRNMCWNQGDWRFYKHYKQWQYKTYQLVLEIVKKEQIDIIHQLNMIGFREPGYLWKIQEIPFVWGPIDAKESFPVAYLESADFNAKAIVRLKNFITRLQLRHGKRIKSAVNRANVVVAASSNSKVTLKKFHEIEAHLLNETGCNVTAHPLRDKSHKKTLDLLWVGKLDFRKQLELAIQTLAYVDDQNIKLHIVGGGDAFPYQQLTKKLGVAPQCKWYGVIPHKKVQQMMQNSDLLFFTSVAEGTPHVVLEAIANHLPVLCFDTCGHGDSVDEKVGVKIPLTTPKKSVLNFAKELNYLLEHRGVLNSLSVNCSQRQQELSWDKKANKMVSLYQKCLKI